MGQARASQSSLDTEKYKMKVKTHKKILSVFTQLIEQLPIWRNVIMKTRFIHIIILTTFPIIAFSADYQSDVQENRCAYDPTSHACYFVSYDNGMCTEIGSTQPSQDDCFNSHCPSASQVEAVYSLEAFHGNTLFDSKDFKTVRVTDATADLPDDCKYNSSTGICLALDCGKNSCGPPVGSSQPSEGDCANHCDSVHKFESIRMSRLRILTDSDGAQVSKCD